MSKRLNYSNYVSCLFLAQTGKKLSKSSKTLNFNQLRKHSGLFSVILPHKKRNYSVILGVILRNYSVKTYHKKRNYSDGHFI